MSTLRAVREALVEIARRHSRVAHEAEDLAHDILLSALRRGDPLESQAFLRSLRGAARRHGAFLARSAARRRAREAREAREAHEASGALVDAVGAIEAVDAAAAANRRSEAAPLSALSPSLRTTLLLLFLGLEKAELRLALGVTDAALRKRFQALRDHGPLARPDLAPPRRTPALSRLRRYQVKLLPRLAAVLVGNGARRVLAASDPDGHGLIFAEALTPGRRAATTEAPATNAPAPEKGTPCSPVRSRTSRSSSS
jgi:DNA-directed RNA polymerase specialized sigma24 family protein